MSSASSTSDASPKSTQTSSDDESSSQRPHDDPAPQEQSSTTSSKSPLSVDTDSEENENLDKSCCGSCLLFSSTWANKAPCCWALLVILLPLICSISLIGVGVNLETDGGSFAVRGDSIEADETSAELANMNTIFRVSEASSAVTSTDIQTNVEWVLTVYWEDRSDDQNLFTNERLDFMLSIHRGIFLTQNDDPNFNSYTDFCLLSRSANLTDLIVPPCFDPQTVLTFFYPPSAFTSPTAPPPRTEDPDIVIQNILADPGTRETFLDLVGPSFDENSRTGPVTRSIFPFAAPLRTYVNIEDRFGEQEGFFSDWVIEVESEVLNNNNKDDFDIRMTWLEETLLDAAFNDLIFGDTIFALVAIVVLWIYMWFHTGSLFLSLGSMCHILLSFSWAVFFFTVIYQITIFPFLNVLGIYIILGIGADDVFIFLDAWKQSKKLSGVNESLETRMAWTYARACKAMLITSFTTAVAFFINGVSTVVAVALFGIFTGTMIFLNYLLVVTWFPLIVLFWTNHLEHRTFSNWCGFKKTEEDSEAESDEEDENYSCCFCIPLEKPFLAKPEEDSLIGKFLHHEEHEENLEKDIYAENIDKFRFLEKFFYNYYVPFLARAKYFCLFFFCILLALTIAGASMLAPSDEPARFLPTNHPIQIAFDLTSDFSASNAQSQVQLFWGIDRLDTSGRDPYNFEDQGTIVWNPDFDLSQQSSQELFLQVCDELRGNLGVSLEIRDQEIFCVMEEFNNFHNLSPGQFITGTAFLPAFVNFTENFETVETFAVAGSNILTFEDTVGWDVLDAENGIQTLRHVSIVGNLTFEPGAQFEDVLSVFDLWDEYIQVLETRAETTAPGMTRPLQSAEDWRQAETQRQLVATAVLGIAVSLALAFVVISISSKNFIVAFLTTVAIGGIVCFVLTFIVLIGWGLGIIESISITILVGLSVDYVTHVSNSINESRLYGRFPRVREGMTEIGISIFSSAVTTTLSAILLLGAIVIFFVRFGIFIIITILASALYAFIFYPSLALTIAGLPNNKWGNYVYHARQLYNFVKNRNQTEDSKDSELKDIP